MNLDDEKNHVVNVLNNFVSGDVGDWDFDDLINIRSTSALVRKVSLDIEFIRNKHPGRHKYEYVDADGLEIIKLIINRISAGTYL